jgi:hypothetical protein
MNFVNKEGETTIPELTMKHGYFMFLGVCLAYFLVTIPIACCMYRRLSRGSADRSMFEAAALGDGKSFSTHREASPGGGSRSATSSTLGTATGAAGRAPAAAPGDEEQLYEEDDPERGLGQPAYSAAALTPSTAAGTPSTSATALIKATPAAGQLRKSSESGSRDDADDGRATNRARARSSTSPASSCGALLCLGGWRGCAGSSCGPGAGGE